jgi:hypothetical protein
MVFCSGCKKDVDVRFYPGGKLYRIGGRLFCRDCFVEVREYLREKRMGE